jgi:ArpU family phage transcriptional regulator
LPEIDKQATKKLIKTILKQYRRAVRLSGTYFQVKTTDDYMLSPVKQLEPNEYDTEFSLQSQKFVLEVNRSINKLNYKTKLGISDRRRLYEAYLMKQEINKNMLIRNYGESESAYYEHLSASMIRFAKVFSDGELIVSKVTDQKEE